jgi:hypothetical protein
MRRGIRVTHSIFFDTGNDERADGRALEIHATLRALADEVIE